MGWQRMTGSGYHGEGQLGRKADAFTASRGWSHEGRVFASSYSSTSAVARLARVVAIVAILCSSLPRTGEALVSYCRDSSPHSYSLQQAEVICETEGEYNFRMVVDKSNQRNLYDDLGEQNVGRRFTAMSLDERTVAKYANLSEFVLHVQVLNASVQLEAHHCCQVCRIDCEQMRYACPRRDVDSNDNCTATETQVETCRFSEALVDVRARVVCALKVAKTREIPASWFSDGFSLRTSPRNCPYRRLENNAFYVVMATLSTPNYGREDTLVGADMIIAVPKKYRSQLPLPYVRGIPELNLLDATIYLQQQPNSTDSTNSTFLLANRNATVKDRCPTRKAIRSLAKLSSSATATVAMVGPGRPGHIGSALLWTMVAAAVAAVAGRLHAGASRDVF